MILPIGHEDSAVRRQPWVTWALIVVCTLVYFATDHSAVPQVSDDEAHKQQAVDYLREHPWLRGDPEITLELLYDVPPNQRSQYQQSLVALKTGRRAIPIAEIAEQQAELDRLTDIAFGFAEPENRLDSNSPFRRYGLVPADLSLPTLFTHMFLHASLLHLLGNMLLLFVLGPAVEDRFGRPIYAAFYLTSGVFAGLFHASLAHDVNMPMVGASGAIAGVMGGFVVRHFWTQIRFAYLFLVGVRLVRGTFEAPAWAMLPLWFCKELLSAWWNDAAQLQSSVAYWAHVGGFLGGAGLAGILKAAKIEERFIHDRIEAQVSVSETNPAVETALVACEEGDHEAALAILQEEIEAKPDDEDVVLALWEVAGTVSRPSLAAPGVARLIERRADSGELADAAGLFAQLAALAPSQLIGPKALMRMLPAVRERGDGEVLRCALRQAVHPENSGLTTGMAMRLVDDARELEPAVALRAAQRALENEGLHEAKRAKLEAVIAECETAGVDVSEAEVALAAAAPEEAEAPADATPWDETGAIEIELDDDPHEFGRNFMANRNATDDEAGLRARDDTSSALALDATGERVTDGVVDEPPGRAGRCGRRHRSLGSGCDRVPAGLRSPGSAAPARDRNRRTAHTAAAAGSVRCRDAASASAVRRGDDEPGCARGPARRPVRPIAGNAGPVSARGLGVRARGRWRASAARPGRACRRRRVHRRPGPRRADRAHRDRGSGIARGPVRRPPAGGRRRARERPRRRDRRAARERRRRRGARPAPLRRLQARRGRADPARRRRTLPRQRRPQGEGRVRRRSTPSRSGPSPESPNAPCC